DSMRILFEKTSSNSIILQVKARHSDGRGSRWGWQNPRPGSRFALGDATGQRQPAREPFVLDYAEHSRRRQTRPAAPENISEKNGGQRAGFEVGRYHVRHRRYY